MTKYMVFGHATFLGRKMRLGEFAAPGHAGISIREVSDRIESAQDTNKFVVTTLKGSSKGRWDRTWDLKGRLKKVVEDLDMDNWGIEYSNDELSGLANNK